MHAFVKTISVSLVSMVTTACASTSGVENHPALIVPSSTSVRVLTNAVSTLLNGRSVTLAPESLTKRPTLIMDPVFAIGPDGNPIMGRSIERPDHFQLVKRGSACVLVHEETGKEMALEGVECVAVEPD